MLLKRILKRGQHLPDETAPEETVDAAEEPSEAMSPESLEEAYDNSIKAFTDGEIVKGVVVDVNRDEVMIDIGFKSEGYIPASEFEPGQEGLRLLYKRVMKLMSISCGVKIPKDK